MSESGSRKIELFNDFFTGVDKTSEADKTTTWDAYAIGDFHMFGNGSDEVDQGAFVVPSALSGVVRLTTTNETEHCAAIGTGLSIQPSLMGTICLEARVQFNNTATKETFIGFSDTIDDVTIIEGEIMTGATVTLTYTASDLIGFFQSADLTDADAWHLVAAGGSGGTTGTGSVAQESTRTIVAGEWDVLRLEIDTNGTARWYVNGNLEKTLVGAVAPTTVFGLICGVEAKGANVEELDVDYLLLRANRDWTI